MKKLIVPALALAALPLLADPIKIMPLGDSITYGMDVPGGYRLPLYQKLTAAGYKVDYIGTQTGNPSPDLPDSDHEGHPGWCIKHDNFGVYQNIGSWLTQVEAPDVILLHLGTNDAGYAHPDEIRDMIVRLHNLLPQTHIIATTLLGRTDNADLMARFQTVVNPYVEGIVDNFRSQDWPVHYLDMYSALDYTHEEGQPPADLADGLHPSPQGYEKMAKAWFGKLTEVFGSDGSAFTSVGATKRTYGYEACGVPASETADYEAIYDFDITASMDLSTEANCKAFYKLDRSDDYVKKFSRIAYFLELYKDGQPQYAWVSVDAFTNDVKAIGVPTLYNKVVLQQNVSNMNVFSNVDGVETGTGIATGNIEFWPYNFATKNEAGVPDASDATYDFGDKVEIGNARYGSMQIHNYGARQTIIGLSNLSKGEAPGPCLGIGNNPTPGGNPDWTRANNAITYDYARMMVLVKPIEDTEAPVLQSARVFSVDGRTVRVTFDEYVIVAGLSQVSFTAGGVSAVSAHVLADKRIVDVTFAAPVSNGATLTAKGLCDYAGNTLDSADVTVAARENVPEEVSALVGDLANDYRLVADIDIPVLGNFNSTDVAYVRSSLDETATFDRVAYCMVLEKPGVQQYVWTAFDAMTLDLAALGVPVSRKGRYFQQKVNHLEVSSNVEGITNGTFDDGNIEFWSSDYGGNANGLGGDNLFDFDDTVVNGNPTAAGHGSMQVHNYRAKQTLWAINRFGNDGNQLGIGIGPQVGGNTAATDWTFEENAGGWTRRKLYVLVRLGKPDYAGLSAQDKTAIVQKYGSEQVVGTVPSADLAGFELVAATDLGANMSISYQDYCTLNMYLIADNRKVFKLSGRSLDRIGYYMLLKKRDEDPVWVWTAMDAFTQDVDQLAIPTGGYFIKEKVANLTVRSNSPAVTPDDYPAGGIVEFWASNYASGTTFGDVGGSAAAFDWDDSGYSTAAGGHGSMQVHNAGKGETLWSITKFNAWNNSQIGIGIGNDPNGNGHTDYTYTANGGDYEVRQLYIYVKPGAPVIRKARIGTDGRTVTVSLSEDFALNGQSQTQVLFDGLPVSGVRALRSDSLTFTRPDLVAGTVHTVTLRQVRTSAGIVPELAAAVTVPAALTLPEGVVANVGEVSDYRPVLGFTFAEKKDLYASSFAGGVDYDLDERDHVGPFDRVAYCVSFTEKGTGKSCWTWVSMDAFTSDPYQLGIPYYGSGIYWQRQVTNMNVWGTTVSNAKLTTGTGLRGNLEFWSSNYAYGTGLPDIGGNGGAFDFNDIPVADPLVNGYGSMQVHCWENAETVFAINRFGGRNNGWLDFGIGTFTDDASRADWTTLQHAQYWTDHKLYVFVRPKAVVPSEYGEPLMFFAQPISRRGKIHQTVRFVASAEGATSYQWYKDGAPIPEATGPVLELTNLGTGDAGSYKVLAIGPASATFSDAATLTVIGGFAMVVR